MTFRVIEESPQRLLGASWLAGGESCWSPPLSVEFDHILRARQLRISANSHHLVNFCNRAVQINALGPCISSNLLTTNNLLFRCLLALHLFLSRLYPETPDILANRRTKPIMSSPTITTATPQTNAKTMTGEELILYGRSDAK
jgi:hypothetical protein